MKKFTLPHSEQEIADQLKIVEEAENRLAYEKSILDAALRDNRTAERAEEIRKARILTPSMRKILELMTAGNVILRNSSFCRSRPVASIETKPRLTIPEPTFKRLQLARFIDRDADQPKSHYQPTRYVITDEGREALK